LAEMDCPLMVQSISVFETLSDLFTEHYFTAGKEIYRFIIL
jgi:hypothetical protein